jgi:hypothetical protein
MALIGPLRLFGDGLRQWTALSVKAAEGRRPSLSGLVWATTLAYGGEGIRGTCDP